MKLTFTTTVPIPRDMVWRYVASPEEIKRWNPNLEQVKPWNDERGFGARYEVTYRLGPNNRQLTAMVTRHTAPTVIEYQLTDQAKSQGYILERYELEGTGTETTVRQTIDLGQLRLGLGARVALFFITKFIKPESAASLRRLASVIEEDGIAGTSI